jgi:putative DNA primase/helicase
VAREEPHPSARTEGQGGTTAHEGHRSTPAMSAGSDPRAAFRDAIRRAGRVAPEGIDRDGKLHRFASNGKRGDDAGWYVFHQDGIPAGCFGDWRTGPSQQNWRADLGRPLTPAELAAHQARVDAARRAREAEEARRRARAVKWARSLWAAGSPLREADPNPYLTAKRVAAVPALREIHAGKMPEILGYTPKSRKGEALVGRCLVAPVKIGDELSTLALIDESGRKHFLAGGATGAGYWAAQPLPDGDGTGLTISIGEGVATVLSVREATGHLAVAALCSSNLRAIAEAMRERYPRAVIVLLADLLKDTGLPDPHAGEAAGAVGGVVAVPDFGGDRPEWAKDYNDLAVLRGREAAAECIRRQTLSKNDVTAVTDVQPRRGAGSSCYVTEEPGVTDVTEDRDSGTEEATAEHEGTASAPDDPHPPAS